MIRDPADQEVSTTASRRLRRGEDLRAAVRWMTEHGFHPEAGPGTVRTADDFADRMGASSEGHVAYGLEQMTVRLNRSRRWVAHQVRILRELGLLAWVEHGSSRRNALRTRYGDGFRPGMGFVRTATLYAPCAPRVWDEARGRRVDGFGYAARVIGVTARGRHLAVEEARARVPHQSRCTPSFTPTPTQVTVQEGGKKNYTGGVRRNNAPRQSGRSPQQVAADVEIARWIRPRVGWVQRAGLRQLAFGLRPLVDSGLDREDIAATLSTWSWGWGEWRPHRPAAYLLTHTAGYRKPEPDAAQPEFTGQAVAICASGPQSPSARAAWESAVRTVRERAARPEQEQQALPNVLIGFPHAAQQWRDQEEQQIRDVILASLEEAAAASRARRRTGEDFGRWLAQVEREEFGSWRRSGTSGSRVGLAGV
ncbi:MULTISPECIES: hypothetical protein [unclassified Streptomyces]|uniref:hypothetical protein n=1 Tax=unclassified Streptomyces TaxID=2593676 RepID=UPI002DD8849B|nr:hypothetical protein [Streptomyces sp. NBC_01795]WSA97759.1 hypothetical protein OIE63_40445 [Streptomyces sp. NBC_01795]WSS46724.1 hypothetical protein OG220_39775 [Streptomyces sp. NBC_01187]WSS47059.1 hypothetical protein OG220_41850 [Streptomyces sp. NBC_01187]